MKHIEELSFEKSYETEDYLKNETAPLIKMHRWQKFTDTFRFQKRIINDCFLVKTIYSPYNSCTATNGCRSLQDMEKEIKCLVDKATQGKSVFYFYLGVRFH